MRFSVVIPTHNEERYLPGCLDSIERAAGDRRGDVEVIVVLNRCSDGTEQIALERGAKTVQEEGRCLAKIRNAGARVAVGEVLLTIDADSRMSANMLREIDGALKTGRYVGGGVPIRTERTSLGIGVTAFTLDAFMRVTGLSCGLFWCLRRDFEAVGGFDETLNFGEDVDFAKRLRAYGRKRRLRYATLRRAHIVTSCRKFDRFGDWHAFSLVLFRARELLRGYRGTDRWFSDRYYYDFNSPPPPGEKR
jgi:glycosyltransferase involved in cell wall biosynthesis